jgi:hypothetical protein
MLATILFGRGGEAYTAPSLRKVVHGDDRSVVVGFVMKFETPRRVLRTKAACRGEIVVVRGDAAPAVGSWWVAKLMPRPWAQAPQFTSSPVSTSLAITLTRQNAGNKLRK